MPNEWARLNLFITTRKQLSAIGLAERNRKRTRQLGRRRFLHQYERGMLNIGPIFGSIGKVFRKPRQDLASISSEFSLTLISCSRVAFTCRSLLSARSDRRRRSFSMRIESLISFTSFCNLKTAKKTRNMSAANSRLFQCSWHFFCWYLRPLLCWTDFFSSNPFEKWLLVFEFQNTVEHLYFIVYIGVFYIGV